MKTFFSILFKILAFLFLTVLTQLGGFIYFLNIFISRKWDSRLKKTLSFMLLYLFISQLIVPYLAPMFGREKVMHSEKISPTNFMTVLLNRNYVRPELNQLLAETEVLLKNTPITINYLDANFPFFDGFPLIPHLSHNDGKKIDLSLIYEDESGKISTKQKSFSGYGVYEEPKNTEYNQTKNCLANGFYQYGFSKYVSFGKINKDLKYSESGTALLISKLLKSKRLGKMFIEPHLKSRLNFSDNRIRFHGCRAVRHDDHIHIQL